MRVWQPEPVACLNGAVTRWLDDDFPGSVEVQLADCDGAVVVLSDKVPVFGLDGLTADTPLPVSVEIACDVLRYERDPSGRDLAVVVLSHGVTDQDDRNEFRVLASQVRSEPRTSPAAPG